MSESDNVLIVDAAVRQLVAQLRASTLTPEQRTETAVWVVQCICQMDRQTAIATGEFEWRQVSQIGQLERLVARIRADRPDLELERLKIEGTAEQLEEYLWERLDRRLDES